jgi:hypothetical protein
VVKLSRDESLETQKCVGYPFFTLTFDTAMTAGGFGFTHENSVRLSFLPAKTHWRPIGTVLYGIVSNAVPLLSLLSTHNSIIALCGKQIQN